MDNWRWLRDGETVYQLNEFDQNLWSAQVQRGYNSPEHTAIASEVARRMESLPQTELALNECLSAIKSTIEVLESIWHDTCTTGYDCGVPHVAAMAEAEIRTLRGILERCRTDNGR